jgi:hypothetical protein
MGAGAATLLLHAMAAAVEAEADRPEWQYYCFRGASLFASADPVSRFNVLPSSGQVLGHVDGIDARSVGSPVGAGSEAPASGPASSEAFVDVAARIAPLTGSCFFQRGGYWTYEVCPGRRVRQYHSENALSGAAKVRTEFSLGEYDPDGDEYVAAKGVFSQVRAREGLVRIAVRTAVRRVVGRWTRLPHPQRCNGWSHELLSLAPLAPAPTPPSGRGSASWAKRGPRHTAISRQIVWRECNIRVV